MNNHDLFYVVLLNFWFRFSTSANPNTEFLVSITGSTSTNHNYEFLVYELDLNLVSLQGKRLEENVTEGVILGNQTLVLQSVELDQAGLYTCVASNTVADGESNALHLDIKCRSMNLKHPERCE